MKLLALDTTTKFLSMALSQDGKDILEMQQFEPFMHAERLNLILKALLDVKGWSIQDIDTVLLPKGPGLFTSLRVAFSFAKALKVVKDDIRFLVVDPFRAMWYPYRGYRTIVCLDAKKNEVFAEGFDERGEVVLEVGIYEPKELKDRFKDFLFVGEGAELHRDVLINLPPNNVLFPRASYMIQVMEYTSEVDVSTYEPLYIRLPDAIVNLLKKNI